MAETIRCDQCGKVAYKARMMTGWVHVEKLGFTRYEEPPELDFCSWPCVGAYAAARVQ